MGMAIMLLIVLLVVLAIASGALGIIIKGAFWLFILTVLFLVGAYFAGRASSRARSARCPRAAAR